MTMSYTKGNTRGKKSADEWVGVPVVEVSKAVYENAVQKMDTSKAGLYSSSKRGRKVYKKDILNRKYLV